MFRTLEADTANDLWKKAAFLFAEGALGTKQTSRIGNTTEVMNVALTLHDPRQRWIATRSPAMNPAFAIAEVVWILQGRNDSAMLNYFNTLLPKFAGAGPTYHGAYGHRLRRRLGIDQLDRAYRALSANAESRQIVLQIWDAEADFPNENGSPVAEDIPCNVVSLLKVRNNKLEWTQIMRSNDLFRGFPHNVVQFTSLQEVFAGWLGVEVGAYHHYSDSLHLYESDGDVRDRIVDCNLPANTDSLAVSKEESDRAFQILGMFCDFLARAETHSAAIVQAVTELALPPAFNNLGCILAADALRRLSALPEMNAVLNRCDNACLKTMFERWHAKPRPQVAFSTKNSVP